MTSLVVVPTYQEAGNVRHVLDAVLAAADVDVLVVDDDSPDGTGALVVGHPAYGHRVLLLHRSRRSGLGAAYRAGFAWALRAGYDTVAQMDADLSHPPGALPALLAALEGCDVVIGSRYVEGGLTRGWSRRRALLSRAGNAYVRHVLDVPVRDATAGFRAFRAAALVALGVVDSESDGYAFQLETTWQAHRRGLVVREVPITFTERAVGASKMSPLIVLEALWRVAVWRWRDGTGVSGGLVGAACGGPPGGYRAAEERWFP